MIKIKLSKQVQDFLTQHTVVDEKYFYIPFWYEKNEDGTYTPHNFENLPEELKKAIKDRRK